MNEIKIICKTDMRIDSVIGELEYALKYWHGEDPFVLSQGIKNALVLIKEIQNELQTNRKENGYMA